LTLHPVPKNMKNLDFFPIFVGHFRTPGSGSAIWMRIRIQQLKLMRIRIRNPGLLINLGLTQLTAFPNKKASGSRGQRNTGYGNLFYHSSGSEKEKFWSEKNILDPLFGTAITCQR
jgi:hypothetical protein